jgi:L-asparaginase/Glu-tRNA(Gln) amidotransferase subunit D
MRKYLEPNDTILDFNYKKVELSPNYPLCHTVFTNTGGTISSGYNFNLTGVQCMDIRLYDRKLNDFLIRNKVNYETLLLKLSEDYVLQDYNTIHQYIRKSRFHKFLFTHGTDNISYFSSWIKILCQKYNKSAVIIVSQRSWDRPTCELHSILESSHNILENLRSKEVWNVTYHDENYIQVHHPFYIRKIDTYSKRAFYSENSMLVPKNTIIKRFKRDLNFMYDIRPKLEVTHTLGIESIFQKSKDTIVLGTGLGHTQDNHYFRSSIVRQGPLNKFIYYKQKSEDLQIHTNKNIIQLLINHIDLQKFSCEALFIILNFLLV